MVKRRFLFPVLAACFLVISFFVSNNIAAQNIPPFKMQLTNGKFFSASDLSNTKPVIIIYFAPDCEHCQKLLNEFFKDFKSFKKAQIVLVTFKQMNEVIDFEKLYKTSKYPNVKVGIESPIFFFKDYYNLQNTPFTALFNKNGKLIVSYKKETSVKDLIKHLDAL